MKKSLINKLLRRIVYPVIFGCYLCFSPALAHTKLPVSKFQQQTPEVSGTITDANSVLPGVSITVKGKNSGTISNFNGNYNMVASSNDTLVFSYMG